MRYYQPFPAAVPLYGPGCPRVTHPSATKLPQDSFDASISIISVTAPFDLHVLGTPPAFILSQDRTLEINFTDLTICFVLFLKSSSVTDDVDLRISPKIRCRFFYLSSAFRHSAEYFYSVNKESTLVCLCFLLSKLHCCSVFKVPRTKLNAFFGECNAYLNILILRSQGIFRSF